MKSSQLPYRADIDGLRAVAVLSVVFCHAGLGFSGGFVGVDVFFVISGYLITRLILRDLETDSFSLLEFWERRIRRIVPALLTVTIASSVAGWLLLLPNAYASLGKSIVGLFLLLSNVQFWRETGYFETVAEVKPLLHTWSLAVEEQFYLLVPILLLLVVRLRLLHRVFDLMVLAAILSFGWSVYGIQHYPSATFYLLPARAWELLVGVLLAIRPARWPSAAPRWNEFAAILGIAGILLPCWFYDKETRFPGLCALPPVAGAALLILSGGTSLRLPVMNRILAWRPLVFVGLISYSLYLWHWPLFAFTRSQNIDRLELRDKTLLIAASLVLSIVTWRYVEIPFRHRKVLASRRWLLTATAMISGTMLVNGLVVYYGKGFEWRLPPHALRFAATSRQEARYILDLDASDIPKNLVHLGDSEGPVDFLVWGDSHAMAVLPAIESLCKESGVAAGVATHTSTAPVIEFFSRTPYGLNERAIPFNTSVMDYIKTGNVKAVLLAANWGRYFKDPGFPDALLRTIDAIQATGVVVFFMNDVPVFDFDVPDALVRYSWWGWDLSRLQLSQREYEELNDFHPSFLPRLRSRGAIVLDPVPLLQARIRSTDLVPFDSGGSFYHDDEHLSTYGALALKPLFAPMFCRRLPLPNHLFLDTSVGDESDHGVGLSYGYGRWMPRRLSPILKFGVSEWAAPRRVTGRNLSLLLHNPETTATHHFPLK